MSEPKYRDWILETIDSLRSRKARPDLERICRMVRRRHGSDPDRTREELEKLIQEQTVLKVSYKGSISYRNAAKVQRKSRKKSEFTPGSADAAREQTKHASLNNNGDSAHSFSDQEESGDKEDSEPSQSPDPRPKTPTITLEKKQKPLPPTSGNGCISCGATVCAVGSGCSEKASASKDKRLGQAGGGSTSPGHDTSADDNDATGAPSKAKVVRGGGVETGSYGGKEGSSSNGNSSGGADMEKKTCSGSASSSNNHPLRQKQPPQLKPKVRIGGGKGGSSSEDPAANSDLGDRLVASVRSLAEKNRGSSVATRGHKPLGLKEILGYLSSQERLSEEKLTRSKVRVVLEREVARGRLCRTRCGNVTLPLRGIEAAKPPARLLKSALQDRHIAKKEEVKEEDKLETDSGEEEEEEEESGAGQTEDGGQSDPGTSGGEEGAKGAPRPSVPMETEPVPNDDITEDAGGRPSSEPAAVSQENMPPQHHSGTGVSEEAGPQARAACPSAQMGGASGSESLRVEERAVTSEQLHTRAPDPTGEQSEGGSHTSSVHNQNGSGCKTEVGVSSCLLTPTASPSGLAEERGMNGGVFVKSECGSLNPVHWTVADVVGYFTAAGFPEQALAFRTQEIDGKSLLLMQRNDVLTGLSIRLGPALKIYERHIKVLQRTHFEEDDC